MENSIDEYHLNSNSKKSPNIDLNEILSSTKLSKHKRCLFDLFLLINTSWIKKNITKINNLSAYFGIIVKQLQFQSLVLLSTAKKQSSRYDSAIETLLNYIRFDISFITYSSQNSLTYFSIGLVFTVILMFVLIYIQLFLKHKFLLKLFIFIFGSTIWIIENYLMIPLIIYSTVYIRHSWFVSDSFTAIYNKDLQFNWIFGLVFLLQTVCLYVIIIMNTIFNYINAYSYEIAYTRAHSVVSLMQISFIFILSIIHILVSPYYYLYINICIGVFMLYNYMHYLPYYSNFDNLIDSGLWLVLAVSSALSILNDVVPNGFETTVCLVLMLPVIYSILWSKIESNFTNKCSSVLESPYLYELRIRKLCYNVKEINEETIQKIRDLFIDCTKDFIEYKLMFIWECNFELRYSGNTTLAMMKLVKYIYSNSRPDFLKAPQVIYRSVPDIESEFLYYKLYKKIIFSNVLKDVSLLTYLKKYSKSNHLDKESCKILIELIDCNLESKKYKEESISKKCIEFFNSLKLKELTLSKYLKKYNDDSDYLSQYKNFKEQLFYSADLNSTSQQDKRRESFIDKAMGFNSEQKVSKIIISGSPADLGRIIYVNRTCVDLLGANSSGEILGKNFMFLIPKPYDAMHFNLFKKFLLFGYKTDIKRNHFMVLDLDGFSIEVSFHLNLTFHAQVPYFVLDIVAKSPKECSMLLDIDGKILCYSEELKFILNNNQKYIQEVLPGIDRYFCENQHNTYFFYNEKGINEMLRRFEIKIGNTPFNILYLYEDESSFKFNHNLHNIPIKFSRQNSLLSKPRTKDLDSKRSKKISFLKRRQKTIENSEVLNRNKIFDYTGKIEKLSKVLLYANIVTFLVVALIILVFTITEINISNSQSLCSIIDDTGKMRLYLTDISKNSRSYYLSSLGLTYSDNTTYKWLMKNSSELLQSNLNNLKSYSDIFPVTTALKSTYVELIRKNSDTYTLARVNLFEALMEVSQNVDLLVNSDFSSTESLYFIYNNCFDIIFKALNSTIYEIFENIIYETQVSLNFTNSIKTILFVPLLVLLTISIFLVIMLENINTSQWKNLSTITFATFIIVRNKVIERMKNLHLADHIFESVLDRKEALYLRFWKKYFFLIACFLLIILSYYLIVNYLIEQPLHFITQLALEHRFWGGLRRSLLNLAFIWSRETLLLSSNQSYSDIITQFSSIPSSSLKFSQYSSAVQQIEGSILKQTFQLKKDHNFDYSDYLTCLCKSSCMTFEDNSSAVLSQGIHSAISALIFDMSGLTNSSFSLPNLEFNTNTTMSALRSANSIHQSTSNSIYTSITNYYILTSTIFIFLILIYYQLLLKPEILHIQAQLQSRNQIILMFKEKAAQVRLTNNKST